MLFDERVCICWHTLWFRPMLLDNSMALTVKIPERSRARRRTAPSTATAASSCARATTSPSQRVNTRSRRYYCNTTSAEMERLKLTVSIIISFALNSTSSPPRSTLIVAGIKMAVYARTKRPARLIEATFLL